MTLFAAHGAGGGAKCPARLVELSSGGKRHVFVLGCICWLEEKGGKTKVHLTTGGKGIEVDEDVQTVIDRILQA